METLEKLGKNVYMVGIKGAGMAGLAQILQGLGYRVEGSDITDSFFTDTILRQKGITVHEGFDVKNIPSDSNWAISSAAYLAATNNNKNAKIKELEKRNIPIVSYPQALGYFFNQCYGIAVTGTHGKSTTAAMIAFVLGEAGKDPFALIGGELLNWHSGARVPRRLTTHDLRPTTYFVIEADEYREQFLNYKPNVIVITNIDYDHPDYFKTPKQYEQAFSKFKTTQLKPHGIVVEGKNLKLKTENLKLQVIGNHNQENAQLAYETCRRLGIEHVKILEGLKKFKGLRRRLETIGERNDAIIIDDYAHHPAEIKASLLALREAYQGKKLIVLFHPHTYSRTQKFLKEFAKTLTIADEIYLLDVYASAREKKGKVSSNNIVEEMQRLGRDAINLRTIEHAVKYFKSYLKKGNIFVTMGAGDVFRVAQRLTTHD